MPRNRQIGACAYNKSDGKERKDKEYKLKI